MTYVTSLSCLSYFVYPFCISLPPIASTFAYSQVYVSLPAE